MDSVLFVCLGNICRSPLAEAVAKDLVEKKGLQVRIDSAGTGSWHIGKPPCPNSVEVAKRDGLDIAYLRARQVQKEDFERFSLIVALDSNNYRDLKAMGATNVVKLGSYGYNDADVPDPYFYDGFEGFEEVYKMIKECTYTLFDNSIV